MIYSANATDDFYSHARVGRDITAVQLLKNHLDFYSHARVGRDKKAVEGMTDLAISTHTPA